MFPKSIINEAPFSLMTESELQELWQAGSVQSHDPGMALDANILSADALHVLLEGEVRIGSADWGPLSQPGFLSESGCVLLPFDEGVPFSAISKSTTFSLPKEAFDRLLDQGAGAAFAILDHLIEKTTTELRILNVAVQDLLSQSH